METTLHIDDDLMAELKRDAGDEPLARVLNETIRCGLQVRREQKSQQTKPFVQRTVNLGKPLIDINKASSIMDEWEDEERLRKMGLLKEGAGE